jgi:uncharacterized protein YutE (UPF0331/DUF86 family)
LINKDRVLKLLRDYKEWYGDLGEAIEELEKCEDDKIKKLLYHSIRAYFLDFHILCEDYISISLKELKKYKVDISADDGMRIVKDSKMVSEDFYAFYSSSRRLRNRLAHRYKVPQDDDIYLNLKNNIKYIDELEESIKRLLNRASK